MNKAVPRFIALPLIVIAASLAGFAQDAGKRNDRPQQQPAPTPQHRDESRATANPTSYKYEFNQHNFVVSHIVFEHYAMGRGKFTFVMGSEIRMVGPIEFMLLNPYRYFAS